MGIRSTVLRSAEDRIAQNALLGRRGLEEALRNAGGPLVEAADDGSGDTVITFVAIGPKTAPAVRCPIFAALDWQEAMQLLPGTSDVWWAEASTPHRALRTQYRFLSQRIDRSAFHRDDEGAELVAAMNAAYELGYPDPFNPRRAYPTSGFGIDSDLPVDKWDSVLLLPEAASGLAWGEAHTPVGSLETLEIASSILQNSRKVTVWEARTNDSTASLPTVVLLDGEDLLHGVDAPRVFDSLVSRHVIPPFRAVFVHNPTMTSRMTEYPCNPCFRDFVADELMPVLRARYNLPDDPRLIAIGGFSYGGLAATWVAFARPDVFGGVIASSPSMWWGPGVRVSADPPPEGSPRVQPEWLTRQYEAAPTKQLRVWIDVGLLEVQELPFAAGVNMLSCCRSFRDVLVAKGYDLVGYAEQPCGHEYLGWREGLASGLAALFAT